jgi:hypothetical protein
MRLTTLPRDCALLTVLFIVGCGRNPEPQPRPLAAPVSIRPQVGKTGSNDHIESILRRGGKSWSSVAKHEDRVAGDDYWIWLADDHVLVAEPDIVLMGEQSVSFRVNWQLRPGRTLPADQVIKSCAEIPGSGVGQFTIQKQSNAGITKGVLQTSLHTSQDQGEIVVPFYFITKFDKPPRPSSNILLLKVRVSK